MHDWSDKSFDWKGLNDAIHLIADGLRRWRLQVHQVKEKFGSARIYMGGIGFRQVHELIYPGYCYSQFPHWLWVLDCKVGKYLVRWMNWFVVPLQQKIYRYYYEKAVKRFPHLRDEILVMADWQELIEGVGGYKHKDHWISGDDIAKENSSLLYKCRDYWRTQVLSWVNLDNMRDENPLHPMVIFNDLLEGEYKDEENKKN